MEEIVEKIVALAKTDLGSNYHDEDDTLLSEYAEYYLTKASYFANRDTDDEMLKPYVYDAVVSRYLRRGDEGKSSSSEGGLSSNYLDIEEKMKSDLLAIRLFKL